MKGIKYKHADGKLLSNGPNVYDLPVAHLEYADGQKAVESCWDMTLGERIRVLFLGKVYFQCFGVTHPPIVLSASSAKDKAFELKVWRFTIHNKEQWDLSMKPLVCVHWSYDKGNGNKRLKRLFCL